MKRTELVWDEARKKWVRNTEFADDWRKTFDDEGGRYADRYAEAY